MAVDVVAVDWHHADSESLRAAQRVEIAERYGTDDSEPGPAPTADDITAFFVAYVDGSPAGCGGLRAIDAESGEVKRMYVDPAHRGTGVSVAVLDRLERDARERGWRRLLLETGSAQPDAMRFYEREGYARIPNFGHYRHSADSICYGKTL